MNYGWKRIKKSCIHKRILLSIIVRILAYEYWLTQHKAFCSNYLLYNHFCKVLVGEIIYTINVYFKDILQILFILYKEYVEGLGAILFTL